MALTETTLLKQIEIAIDADGVASHVFVERVRSIMRDGVVIAESTHRDSFPAESPEAKAIFGEMEAMAVAGSVAAHDALKKAQMDLDAANERIAGMTAYIIELEAQIQKLS